MGTASLDFFLCGDFHICLELSVADIVVYSLCMESFPLLFICLFVGWKWGIKNAVEAIRAGNPSFQQAPMWTFLVRYVCPIAIAIILVTSFTA